LAQTRDLFFLQDWAASISNTPLQWLSVFGQHHHSLGSIFRALYPSVIGRNDERCVQMAGTQSVQPDELGILGIPRSQRTIASVDSSHGSGGKLSPYEPLFRVGG